MVTSPSEKEKSTLSLLMKRYDRLRADRYAWESHWQDIRWLVHPNAIDFNRSGFRGDRRTENIFDGTAPWALEQLASGLHSFLTSPTDRWFVLTIEGIDLSKDMKSTMWLEDVSDLIYSHYSLPKVNLNNTLHEDYLDLGAFGTGVIYQSYSIKERCLKFKPFPLADCFLQENAWGMIDTCFRRVMMTTRQIRQDFPDVDKTNQKISQEKDLDKQWEVMHAVFPRVDRNDIKMDAKNKKFASFWFCQDAQGIFKESGFDLFPYHCPRWLKRSGEVYGRSPAMTCLPDIKLINAMEKVALKSNQKIVDPPLMVPDSGFMMPINTTPGGLIYYESGMADNTMIKPLETKGRVDIGEEKMKQKRDMIMRCFYADWIQREKKKERQTATEIMDDRDEMLSLMSPILGRIQTELCGPLLALSYNLLQSNGFLPPAPVQIQRKKLTITYISPAARAQLATKANSLRRFTQELIPLAQEAPEILDIIDTDAFAREMADIQDVSKRVLRTPQDVAHIRKERADQQQMQQTTQAAQPAAAAMKDLATAKSLGGIGGTGSPSNGI